MNPSRPSSRPSRGRRFKRALLWGGVPALAAALFIVPRALAGPRWGSFGGLHGHRGHHGPVHADSVEDMKEHMNRKLGHMFDRLEASDAQRAAAEAIVAEAAAELFPLSEQGRELRGQLKQALLAEQVDQGRVASLGSEIEATLGQATRVGIEAIGQVSAVLDPAQRAQVGEFLARFEN